MHAVLKASVAQLSALRATSTVAAHGMLSVIAVLPKQRQRSQSTYGMMQIIRGNCKLTEMMVGYVCT